MEINIALDLLIPLKLLLAAIIGFVIGRERKRNAKPGGSRTFSLVALGSTLIAILSLELFQVPIINESIVRYDLARLMSYGIAGIGFLGAGVISRNRNHVEGLTTAATLWTIVPVGFCIGLGYFEIAVTASIIIYFILDSKYRDRLLKNPKRQKKDG